MEKREGARRRAVTAVVVGLAMQVGGVGIAFAGGGQVVPMASGACGPMPPMTCVVRWTCDASGDWVQAYRSARYACSDGQVRSESGLP